jgi:molybdenum-dependent DNA-binding transcriptional regulator ModE
VKQKEEIFAQCDAKMAAPNDRPRSAMHAQVLRYLDEVVRRGSIRKAAEALHIASSAVNRQILKLEAEIGAPLFERRVSGVRLTPAGEILARHARETLYAFSRSRASIDDLKGLKTGHVRVVALDSLMVDFCPAWWRSFTGSIPASVSPWWRWDRPMRSKSWTRARPTSPSRSPWANSITCVRLPAFPRRFAPWLPSDIRSPAGEWCGWSIARAIPWPWSTTHCL